MKDGPIIIGIDPARPGSDFTALVVKLHDEAFELLRMPPHIVLCERHTTGAEIVARMAEGDRLLADVARRHGKNMLRALIRPPPRRRKWDQYGAYHRRQMKKWLKYPFRLVPERTMPRSFGRADNARGGGRC